MGCVPFHYHDRSLKCKHTRPSSKKEQSGSSFGEKVKPAPCKMNHFYFAWWLHQAQAVLQQQVAQAAFVHQDRLLCFKS